jgi:RibD C-terminal domain
MFGARGPSCSQGRVWAPPKSCGERARASPWFRLIDEYRFYLHPVVLGGGKPFFEAGTSSKLRPLGVESFAQDVTMLRYAPAD